MDFAEIEAHPNALYGVWEPPKTSAGEGQQREVYMILQFNMAEACN